MVEDLRKGQESPEEMTARLAAEFQAIIEKPGAFSWIGVYRELNPDFGIPTVDVYLGEKRNKSSEEGRQLVEAVDVFSDLTLSLRPGADARLHLIDENLVEQLRQRLEGDTNTPPTHQLEFQEQISQSV